MRKNTTLLSIAAAAALFCGCYQLSAATLATLNADARTSLSLRTDGKEATYPVYLKSGENGTISIVEDVDLKAVPANTTLTVKVQPDEGYELAKLVANSEDITETKTFKVVDQRVVVSAKFKKAETPKPTVATFELSYIDRTKPVRDMYGIGNFERNMKVGFALRLPKALLTRYVGARIVGVKMGWSTSKRTGKGYSFATTTLGEQNIAKGNETTLNFGWNILPFAKPYTITESTGDLFFGFYTEVGPKEYPIGNQSYGANPNACFAWREGEVTSSNKEQWANRVREVGMPLIVVELETEAGKFVNNVELKQPQLLEVQPENKEVPVKIEVNNFGINNLNSITVETTHNGKSAEKEIPLKNPILGTTSVLAFLPLNVTDKGEYAIRVSKINGQPNVFEGAQNVNVIAVPNDVAAKYKRKVLIEVFTSEGEGAWPEVNDEFFTPGCEQFTGEKVLVAHHMNDQFMVKKDEATRLTLKMDDNDSTKVYTYEQSIDRTYNPEFRYKRTDNCQDGIWVPDVAAGLYQMMSEIPAFTAVNVTTKVENNNVNITVSGDLVKGYLPDGEKPYITVYLVEDGIVSSSQEFNKDDDEGDAAKKTYVQNWVIRDIATDAFGDALTLNDDGTFSKKYTIELDPEWKLDNLRAVAFVHRSLDNPIRHREVLNANEAKMNQENATKLINGNGTAVIAYQDGNRIAVSGEYNSFTLFNVAGEPVYNQGLEKGVYIVKINTNNGELVRKVVIK